MAAELSREELVRALDAGELQMMRPWGDFVSVRRQSTRRTGSEAMPIHVWMEGRVEGVISKLDESTGFRFFKVVQGNPNGGAAKAGA